MKICNFGSLNIDYVYQVDHIVRPGETISARARARYAGGKGLNQSIAIARAGAEVWHAGKIGKDGAFLRELCESAGVHTDYLLSTAEETGHTVIQVDAAGQNCILVYGGANREITKEDADRVLDHFGPGDLLLLQNEISSLAYIVECANKRRIQVALNPSPYDEQIREIDLSMISLLFVNEVEGRQITGEEDPNRILESIDEHYPNLRVVLTLGDKGSWYLQDGKKVHQNRYRVTAMDTTGAGDTYTGYFIAGLAEGLPIPEVMKLASKAAAISVTRAGAVPSIPTRMETEQARLEEEDSI
ncbi:MAG: ribokinase [Lachnospiraceae bacterium]|jgi:ribokinase|nr:ribokinase [Lachnospiraceae bacterium]MCI1398015.1 ribokinase [Lachnospiraceae bacterium]MCI1424136.1 ribokinase [Lachnospiraceae bacterium]MCI1452940.1 ribokinase [Lachnospiraceae bacterium]